MTKPKRDPFKRKPSRKPKLVKKEPQPESRPNQAIDTDHMSPVEELLGGLHAMVDAAEKIGGRDLPEVVAAHELLAKHEKK
jgi:hypothetical protein